MPIAFRLESLQITNFPGQKSLNIASQKALLACSLALITYENPGAVLVTFSQANAIFSLLSNFKNNHTNQ